MSSNSPCFGLLLLSIFIMCENKLIYKENPLLIHGYSFLWLWPRNDYWCTKCSFSTINSLLVYDDWSNPTPFISTVVVVTLYSFSRGIIYRFFWSSSCIEMWNRLMFLLIGQLMLLWMLFYSFIDSCVILGWLGPPWPLWLRMW